MQAPSIPDRRFGIQMGIALVVVAGFALWRRWPEWLIIGLLSLGALHLVVAFVRPQTLRAVNRAWMGLGHLLGRIFAPIVLGAMFLLIFTPIAIGMRIRGRDALRIRASRDASFWLKRSPETISSTSFSRQY